VADTKRLLSEYNEIAEKLATDYSDELLEQMGRLQEQLSTGTAGTWTARSSRRWTRCAARARRGRRKLVRRGEAAGRALPAAAVPPDLLLLDEPTNHLDAESVQWLEQHLAKYPGTVVAVTHDRYFLDDVAQWILELDRGHAYPTRATTPPTWRPRRPGSRSRVPRTPRSRSASLTSSNGSGQPARPPGQEQGQAAAV